MLTRTILCGAVAALFAVPAVAGECPADQVRDTARPLVVGSGPRL